MKKVLVPLLLLFSGAASAACYPEPGKITMSFSGWSVENYKWADVPASWGATRPYVAWFRDTCTGSPVAQMFNKAEAADVVEQWFKGKFIGSASINAWRLAQGVSPPVLEDTLFMNALLAPKMPYYQVKPTSATVAGDQPAYTLNADQSRNTKAVGRVAGLTRCDGTKRLGTTNYYFVPGALGTVGLYATCVKITPPL